MDPSVTPLRYPALAGKKEKGGPIGHTAVPSHTVVSQHGIVGGGGGGGRYQLKILSKKDFRMIVEFFSRYFTAFFCSLLGLKPAARRLRIFFTS